MERHAVNHKVRNHGRGGKREGKRGDSKQWKLFYANARGILSKKISIIDIFGDIKPEVALFTETMLKTQNFNIDGYTFIGKNRKTKSCGGGVGILIRNDCKDSVTPHETQSDLELLWVSVKPNGMKPIFIGVYYGKQESRNTREQMLNEFDLLATEIHEKQGEGEIVLFMDGNGKIGLLGENISRNGALLLELFEECELEVMNKSSKCEGKITRINRKNHSENSAIDFLLVSNDVEKQISKVKIDEDCDYVLKGSAATDHNSILVDLVITDLQKTKPEKITKWRLNAPEKQWEKFNHELQQCAKTIPHMINHNMNNMNLVYKNWTQMVERKAFQYIGIREKRTQKKVAVR